MISAALEMGACRRGRGTSGWASELSCFRTELR